jgi:hypothetical protein
VAFLAMGITAVFCETCRAPTGGAPPDARLSASAATTATRATVDDRSPRNARPDPAVGAMQEPRLALVPLIAEIRTDFGQPAQTELVLVGRLARQASLSIEKVEGGEVSASVVASSDVGPGSVVLTTAAEVVGSSAGRVFLATGLSDPREIVASYLVRVAGNLSVSPEAPFVDLRAPGPQSVVLNVQSRRPDFRLTGAEVTSGPFEASVGGQNSAGAFVVNVHAVGERMNMTERGVLGRIALVSNDPAEPRKEVAVFALGAPSAATEH